MIERIECRISGERLGYDYTHWISRTANKMGIAGVAFLDNDGSIKVIAEGDDTKLEKFAKRIQTGHPIFHMFVSVTNFSVLWHKATGEYQDFSVLEKSF